MAVVISVLFVPGTKERMQLVVMAPKNLESPTMDVISFLICSRYKRAHATSSYGA